MYICNDIINIIGEYSSIKIKQPYLYYQINYKCEYCNDTKVWYKMYGNLCMIIDDNENFIQVCKVCNYNLVGPLVFTQTEYDRKSYEPHIRQYYRDLLFPTGIYGS